MNALFLSPHNDDETLFASYTLLRYRPFVVVCFKSEKQESQGVTAAEREQETAEAMSILGCEWVQWPFPDSNADAFYAVIEEGLQLLDSADGSDAAAIYGPFDRVFAPAVEEGGHDQHNRIGEIADRVFGDRVTHYMTYTNGRARSTGVAVPYENEWVGRKLCALAQYESQIRLDSINHHFANWPLTEWYEEAE